MTTDSTRTVYLHVGQHPHPLFREQLHAAPPGWRYSHDDPALSDATAPTKRVVERRSRFAPLRERAETAGLRLASELGYVHVNRAPAAPGAALVHSAERLLWRSRLPYVVDFEHLGLFVLYQRAALERPWTRAVLERALLDERVRFLLPWSEAARQSIEASLGAAAAARLAPKVRVVTPAIRLARERPPEPAPGPLRVLFVGTLFFDKGGAEAVRAIERLRESHDVHLDLVSYVPDEWRRRCADTGAITVHTPGGMDLIHALYARSDVLLFPSHMDTFGYVVLEAFAHGVPVLAPRHLALTETVEEGVTGLLFDPENMLYEADTRCAFRHVLPPPRAYLERLREPSDAYVASIAAALARLIDEQGLHARLAEGAIAAVADGQFSMARRREALGAIYDAAAG
jgi:glycosyltransferase involved in cell wall biosynthesis